MSSAISETAAHLSINDLLLLLEKLDVPCYRTSTFWEIEVVWLRHWRYNNYDLIKNQIDWSRYR